MYDQPSKMMAAIVGGAVLMALPFAVFVPLGLYLDGIFGQKPWFFLGALVLAALAAMSVSITKAQRLMNKMNSAAEKETMKHGD